MTGDGQPRSVKRLDFYSMPLFTSTVELRGKDKLPRQSTKDILRKIQLLADNIVKIGVQARICLH